MALSLYIQSEKSCTGLGMVPKKKKKKKYITMPIYQRLHKNRKRKTLTQNLNLDRLDLKVMYGVGDGTAKCFRNVSIIIPNMIQVYHCVWK